MNQKLDQLRKRYANPSAPPDASGVYTLGPHSITADHAEGQPTTSDTNADTHSPVIPRPAPAAGIAEHNKKDQPAIEERPPTDLARDVAALFEPARRYCDRVALSFEAIRALRTELNVLMQSAEPLKGLQDRIVEILDSIRAQLADLATSVEAAKALRLHLSELVQTLDGGTELEAQIHELSRVLAGVSPAKTANDKMEASERSESEKKGVGRVDTSSPHPK
jgi:chromosome segregation ATPase